MDKKSRSGNFFETLETVFGVKIHQFFDEDPGFGIFLTLDPGKTSLIRNAGFLK
jgi:hypothetical protein